jgi:hypothetical protein
MGQCLARQGLRAGYLRNGSYILDKP